MQRERQGFSLLEMSVVIALMGLVAGVILVGQGISRRNEMRSVLVDAASYTMAIQQFQLKYGALPGDFPDATNVWKAAAACPGGASAGKETCNGNGNGVISATVAEWTLCEPYRAWQHLAIGGFIQGNFNGTSGRVGCAPSSLANVNVPQGPIKGSGFSLTSLGYADVNAPSTDWYDGNYDNVLLFGGVLATDHAVGPILQTDTAKELDAKADDGFASTGNIRAPRAAFAAAPNCTVDATGAYKENNRNVACMLVFTSDYNKAKRY